jgi:hypothetical protein
MNESKRRSEISRIIKGIGNVDSLTSEHLTRICRSLYEHITFCNCRKEDSTQYGIQHACNQYRTRYKAHHDFEHAQECSCCQTIVFLYYFGRCMEKLADEDRLPQFDEERLSHAKICDRTYGHVRNGSKLTFYIFRHLGAWTNGARVKEIRQQWEFDFNNLSLTKSNG